MKVGSVKGFHFAYFPQLSNGDKRTITTGAAYKAKGEFRDMCRSGAFHASKQAFDAYGYNSGSILSAVTLSGEIRTGQNKMGAPYRSHNKVVKLTPEQTNMLQVARQTRFDGYPSQTFFQREAEAREVFNGLASYFLKINKPI